MGLEIIVPVISTLAAALIGIGGVSLSNRFNGNQARIERMQRREKELDEERTATRDTILVLSNNVAHIVTELRGINEEFRADRQRNFDWQMKIENRIGTIEGRVERCEKQHKTAAQSA